MGRLFSNEFQRPAFGSVTIDHIATVLAWHDGLHVDQLLRALDGRA